MFSQWIKINFFGSASYALKVFFSKKQSHCYFLHLVPLFFFVLGTLSTAQAFPSWVKHSKSREADSLLSAQKLATSDTQRVRLLNLAAKSFAEVDIKKALSLATEAVELSQKTNNTLGQAQALNIKGYLYYVQGDMANAMKMLTASEALFFKMGGTPEGVSDLYNNLGMVYLAVGDVAAAADNLVRALNINEKQNIIQKLGTNYNNLATLYEQTGEREKALSYYRKALSMWQSVNDKNGQAVAYQNIGNWYFTERNWNKSNQFFRKAQSIYSDLGQAQSMAGVLASLAGLELAQRQFNAAITHMDSARQLFMNFGDRLGLAQCNLLMSQYYMQRGEIPLAFGAAKQAMQLCEVSHYNEGIRNTAEMLSTLTAQMGDHRASLQYYKKFVSLKDSLNSVRNSRRVVALEYKNELETTQLRVKQLQNERDLQTLLLIMFGALVIVGVAFGFVFFTYRRRLDAQTQLVNIAQATPVPIIIFDLSTGTVLYSNATFQEKLGYTPQQLQSIPVKKLWMTEELYRETLHALQASMYELHAFETSLKHENGTGLWVLASTEPIKYANIDALMVGIYDITDRKKNEEELEASKKAIEDAYTELNLTRSQLALSEKLALLGQLFAGIAHEINTPIGATNSSANLALELLPNVLQSVRSLYVLLPAKHADDLFEHLMQNAFNNARNSPSIQSKTTKELRALRRTWTELLTAAHISNAEDTASLIINSGYQGQPQYLIPFLQMDDSGSLAAQISNIGRMFQSLQNILVASQKTKIIVQALKRYTHSAQTADPDSDQRGAFSLLDNLNTILILYFYQIRKVANAETNFLANPTVFGNADKLGQVWTNLITNAVDAMTPPEGVTAPPGLLTLTVIENNGFAEVSIVDSGKGIPKEVLPRIFEPFYTTKPKGVGTGLGLHICLQIVEEFGGTMHVTSDLGRTEFIVKLPIVKSN